MKYVIVGGTMESKTALDYVGSVLHRYEPTAEISTYTYGFAMEHRREINKILRDATLITHSSGALVLQRGAKPKAAIFISPPYPSSRAIIAIRSAAKTIFHSWRILLAARRKNIIRYLLSNMSELLLHPISNLKPFFSGELTRFDLRTLLPRHPLATDTRIIVSSRDELFTTKPNLYSELEQHGVEVIHIDAMHDALFIETEEVIAEALKR